MSQQDVEELGLRVHGGRTRFTRDLYHSLVALSWPRLLLLLVGVYLLTNALFAGLYLLQPGAIANARAGSFEDAFFFSVQAFSTIGFGAMYPATRYGHVLVTAETLLGLLTLAGTTGLVFAKFSLPTARVRFSEKAVICDHEGVPTLQLRLANERANQIVEASVSLTLVRDEVTKEGASFRRIHDLRLARARSPVFAIGWNLLHPIDEASPLHGVDAAGLAETDAVLQVSLAGLDGTQMQTIHARKAYRHQDLLFGYRLVDVIARAEDGFREIDLNRFDEVEPAG